MSTVPSGTVAPLRVGLTGGIGTGKTAVSDRLARLGAVVIDADVLAREVVEPGTPGLAAVTERFGPGVVVEGRLDRVVLGRVVFADPVARADLEAIVHPAVRARAREREAQAPAGATVVHVIPLLVETGQADDFDVVVVVDVDPAVQRARLMARDAMTAAEAERRMEAQASREERLAAADLVINNSAGPAELDQSVVRVWAQLRPDDAAG